MCRLTPRRGVWVAPRPAGSKRHVGVAGAIWDVRPCSNPFARHSFDVMKESSESLGVLASVRRLSYSPIPLPPHPPGGAGWVDGDSNTSAEPARPELTI